MSRSAEGAAAIQNRRINYAVVGAFVILAVAGMIGALLLLTGRTGASDTYIAIYDNVAGVKTGTPVQFEGYQVGQVATVEPIVEGARPRFRVALDIRRGFPIPADSTATIASSGLLAGAAIAIAAGDSAQTLAPGGELPTRRGRNIARAVSDMAGTVDEIASEGLIPLLNKLNFSADALEALMTETAPRIADNLAAASGTLAQGSAALNREVLNPQTLGRVRRILTRLDSAAQTLDGEVLGAANTDRLAATLANLETLSGRGAALSGDLRATAQRLDGLIARLDGLAADNGPQVSAALTDLRYSLDTLAQRIDAITYNVEGTSRNMHEFARQLRRNPSLLLRGGAPAEAGE